MKKEKKKCIAFVERNNERCKNNVFCGANYCFSHYPKREPIVLSLFLTLMSLFIGIIFSEPITDALSKFPLLHRLDKEAPVILDIIPNIKKFQKVDKNTKSFRIAYSDKGSGLNIDSSLIKIDCKENSGHKFITGKLNKTKFGLNLDLDKNLENGEYLLEVLLIDNANHITNEIFPFVVREDKDLEVTAWYKTYEEARDQITLPILAGCDLLHDENLYVYYLRFKNKDKNVILKNLYCDIRTFGRIIWSWKEFQGVNIEGAKLYQHWENSTAYIPDGAFASAGLLNIDEIDTEGFMTFAILVGESKLMQPPEGTDMSHRIELWGQYFSEGYGSSEVHKINEQILLNEKDK